MLFLPTTAETVIRACLFELARELDVPTHLIRGDWPCPDPRHFPNWWSKIGIGGSFV